MHRASGQGDLSEAFLPAGLGRNARLERIAQAFDWSALERQLAPIYAARTGRPSYPPLCLFKALLLQQWYGLSDPALEEAQVRPPSHAAGPGAQSPQDPEAQWTRKGGQSHFGYKAHVAVDAGSGLIRRAILTSARLNESLVADALICGDEGAVYGDKAYESKQRRARLKALGIKDRILHRSHKNQAALPLWQARRNRLIGPIRAAVERVFGTLKRLYGWRRVRYCGLGANATHLRLLVCAYNLRRADALMA